MTLTSMSPALLWVNAPLMTAMMSLVPSSTSLAQGGKEKQLRIVDIPGHPRISKGIFAARSDRAKGIIVVVDAVEFMAQKDQVHSRCLECQSVWMALDHKVASSQLCFRCPGLLQQSNLQCRCNMCPPGLLQVAEQLYDVLASQSVSRRQMPVLLLANKSDFGAKAHSVEFIRKRLEKALDQLRTTRAELDAESRNVRRTPTHLTH